MTQTKWSWNSSSYLTSSVQGVNIGDTVNVRVRNCDGYDIRSVWAYSDYVRQALLPTQQRLRTRRQVTTGEHRDQPRC